MVIVDTSIWVSHFTKGSRHLEMLLLEDDVVCHPFVVAELACGNLKNRREILPLLQALPTVQVAEHDEVLYFIEKHALMGSGVGFVDAHLLASAFLTKTTLWTSDRRLRAAASKLGISHKA